MTTFQYTLTEAQFIAAQRLHVSLRSRGQKLLRGLTLLLGVAVVAGSLYEHTYWLLLAGLIAIFAPWLSWTFTTLPRLLQTYRSSPALQQSNCIALRDGQLCTGTDQADSTLPWSHIIQWAENEQSLLLYLQPQLFIIVPKNSDAPPDLFSALREQLQAQVGPPVA